MARVTPGRPKTGRHPAMWQSVPIESFIQPSVSHHLVSKEHSEHSASPNCNKDIGGSKHHPPKKKVDISHCSSNNNVGPLRNENVEDKGLKSKQLCWTRPTLNPHSAQRHHSNFAKSSNKSSFHATSQNLTFLSNEDDFPTLCSSNSGTAIQETSLLANTSYSEKLKFIQDTSQQNKTKEHDVPVEKEMPSNKHQRNSFGHNLPKYDKKPTAQNRRNFLTTSTPINRQELSNQQWPASHRTDKKSTHSGSRNVSDIDQVSLSHVQKSQSENQRRKAHYSRASAKESCADTDIGGGDKIPSFLSKTQGNTTINSFSTKIKSAGEQVKPDLLSSRYAECATTNVTKDFSALLKSASKRPITNEMKENCISAQVPHNCENVPNVRAVGRMRTDVKSNAPRCAKMVSKYPATAEEKEKGISSDLHSNQQSARDSQPGTSVKTSKKRKNRKSKLKRNLAFQTGKIMILTPELYSRFTGNLQNHSRTAQDCSFDLRDMEEYPELGQVSNNPSSDHHQKMTKAEVISSSRSDNCNPAADSDDCTSKQLLLDDEISSEEANNVSHNADLPHKSSDGIAVKSDQNIQSITDGTGAASDIGTSKKPCSLPRNRMATLEPEKMSASEEKESSLVPEQKPKARHDNSIQISFSDILSSSMIKVKNETSKSRKQNDSRIKVISSKKVKMDKNLHIPLNPLDSSGPGIKRGKERERPKPKKHTALKRIILKERSEKKQRRNILVKEENLKNEATCPKVEEQDTFFIDKLGEKELQLFFIDKEEEKEQDPFFIDKEEEKEQDPFFIDQEGETGTEVEAEDLNDNLCHYLTIEECVSTCYESAKDERLDENLNITVDAVNEFPCRKTEEIYDLSSEEKKMQAIQIAIHTRHFRDYCNHLLSAEIDQVTLTLLGDLTRFQDRLHQKDPVKARIKRRLVYGIKEVTKHLKLKKVKCVVLAPDSENIKSKGGLNDAVSEIVRVSAEYHIPCVFALRRKTLGKACMKPVPVACVGIFNYDGSEANFKKLIELQAESKKAYDAVMTSLKERITKEDAEQLIETQENLPQSLQDLRITILRETLLEKNPDLHLVFTPSGNVQLGRKEE